MVDPIAEALKLRTQKFATNILGFLETLPRTIGGEALARQLGRAGLGVAGNYRSACRARSHAEFTARLGVAVDEADESELWLTTANDQQWGVEQLRATLLAESRELRAILGKSYSTARRREHDKRQ